MLSCCRALAALICAVVFSSSLAIADTSQEQMSNTRTEASFVESWSNKALNWIMCNLVQVMAGSSLGLITTAIVAIQFRANGIPVQNARFVGQMVQAVQNGQGVQLEPLVALARTFKAAYESGIPLNPDGTFAVDWWRLDEAVKERFAAALKRLSGT